jgi:hypothetical protein
VRRIRPAGGFSLQIGERVVSDCDWQLQQARAVVNLLALAAEASAWE